MNIFTKHLCRRMTAILLSAVFLVTAVANFAFAAQDIWYIDSQCVSWTHASEAEFQRLSYYQYGENEWVPSDSATFYATHQPDIPLIIFLPGFAATPDDTVEAGMKLASFCPKERPCRLVFWNWPAQRDYSGLRNDIRTKIPIAAASGRYLAMFLRNLSPGSMVSIFGFSFGNRMSCDAVEFLSSAHPEGIRIRLVMAAAATDYSWLAENHRHGNVPRLAEKILVLYNPGDRALRFYSFLYGDGSRPEALGRFGPPLCAISPENRGKFEAVDVNPSVGGNHRTLLYLEAPAFRYRIGQYLFFDEAPQHASACTPAW